MSYMLENDPYAFDPEREHDDHVAGMASNEFQAAFQASCAQTLIQDDSIKISEARRNGKWVATYESDVCCLHTDALIGISTNLIGEFDSEDEALDAIGGDECACVLPPWVEHTDDDEDDVIPF